MGMTTPLRTDWLSLYFTNADITDLGDGVSGATTPDSLYLDLCDSYPGTGGTVSGNLVSYSGYTQETAARSTAAGTGRR